MSNKTTEKHFTLFKKHCQKWLDVFGLKGWEPYFLHEPISSSDENVEACVIYDTKARSVTFYLSTVWNAQITDKAIIRAAFHEVCELLLGKLNELAKARFARESEVEEANHVIIRTLENVLL